MSPEDKARNKEVVNQQQRRSTEADARSVEASRKNDSPDPRDFKTFLEQISRKLKAKADTPRSVNEEIDEYLSRMSTGNTPDTK